MPTDAVVQRQWPARAHLLVSALLAGCASGPDGATPSVRSAWNNRSRPAAAPITTVPDPGQTPTDATDAPIATVNGRPITRQQVVGLLLESHGAGLLEQIIGLETAREEATRRGIYVNAEDIAREHRLALTRLADPLSQLTPDYLDEATAERLLQAVLSQRNISRKEFDIVIRRSAYLRKLAFADLAFNEEQLRREYNRRFGPRVEVRHIQLATPAEAARIKERLENGDDFARLATAYSANMASARRGGLLEPFSAEDDQVPELFRKTAFALESGAVSDAVRIGGWYHLIRLERSLPAEDRDFASVRSTLERGLRDRLSEPAMYKLFEKLFRGATIKIFDPTLKRAFDRKHPGLARS